MSAYCESCGYDWHTPENVERHQKRGDCSVNMQLRGQIALGILDTTLLPVGKYRELIEAAGLELWNKEGQEGDYILLWQYLVCSQEEFLYHRVWLLETIARRPALYLSLSRRPKNIKSVLLTLLWEKMNQ